MTWADLSTVIVYLILWDSKYEYIHIHTYNILHHSSKWLGPMNLTRSVTCFFASFLPDTWSQDKQHTQTSDRLECKQKHRAARPTRATLWPVLRLQPSDRHLTVSHDRKYQIEARVGIFTTKWVDLCWFQIKVRSHQRVKVKGAPMKPFCCGSICGSNCVVEDNSSKFNMFKNQFNFFYWDKMDTLVKPNPTTPHG